MNKDIILSAIRKNKPEQKKLPEILDFPQPAVNLVAAFTSILEGGNGRVTQLGAGDDLDTLVATLFPAAKSIVSQVAEGKGNFDIQPIIDPHALQDVDVAILKGEIGVAENGAVWVSEKSFGHRVLPFITQHLVLILHAADLVWNMHQAYRRIIIDDTGFGVFIAGPSKTADIEQSLVVGAQGARSLTVGIIT